MAYTEDFHDENWSSERTYPYGVSNTLRARRTDPYGFIYISLAKGQTPEELTKQAFTTFDEADKAIKAFLSRKETVK